MKTTATQQEILFLTTSTLSRRQLCENNTAEKSRRPLSPIEQLEEACWRGLLNNLLPEITEQPGCRKHLYIWQIKQKAFFLQIERSERPLHKDGYYSIVPEVYLQEKNWN